MVILIFQDHFLKPNILTIVYMIENTKKMLHIQNIIGLEIWNIHTTFKDIACLKCLQNLSLNMLFIMGIITQLIVIHLMFTGILTLLCVEMPVEKKYVTNISVV